MILGKIKNKLKGLIKKSYWYNYIVFPDCRKFWEIKQEPLDIVNLGSSSANHAFSYEDVSEYNCANWAMSPQSLTEDLAILQNYSSYIRKGGYVLIPLCPFSCLGGSTLLMNDKYYTILSASSIPFFSLKKKLQMLDIKEHPINYYPLVQLKVDIRNFLKRKKGIIEKQISHTEFDKNAQTWIQNWMKEFSLYSLDDSLTLRNQDSFDDAVLLLKSMVAYCKQKEFNAVFVIPPISEALIRKFPEEIRKKYIYDLISKTGGDVPVLDYIGNQLFKSEELFLNAFYLNSKGRRIFTYRVLKDLKLINTEI